MSGQQVSPTLEEYADMRRRSPQEPARRTAPLHWPEAERLVYVTMIALALILGIVFAILALV